MTSRKKKKKTPNLIFSLTLQRIEMKYPEGLLATFETRIHHRLKKRRLHLYEASPFSQGYIVQTSSLLGTQIPKKLLIPASCVDGSKRVTRAISREHSLLLDWLRKQMYFHGMVNLKRTFRTIPFLSAYSCLCVLSTSIRILCVLLFLFFWVLDL